jgi:hypothetical protein
MSMKNSSDTIGNRIRDLTALKTVYIVNHSSTNILQYATQQYGITVCFSFGSVWATQINQSQRGVTSKTKFRNAVLFCDLILSGRWVPTLRRNAQFKMTLGVGETLWPAETFVTYFVYSAKAVVMNHFSCSDIKLDLVCGISN